jgi:hypothetical protein
MRRFGIVTLLVNLAAMPGLAQSPPVVEVYKSATCGCCANWVAHLRREGFEVKATDVTDLPAIRAKHKVPDSVASCHTALVGGYIVEGHVPAADIKRLLKERPAVRGIAVPGMPMGSPGMEGPRSDAYDVVTFDAAGNVKVFTPYRP